MSGSIKFIVRWYVAGRACLLCTLYKNAVTVSHSIEYEWSRSCADQHSLKHRAILH